MNKILEAASMAGFVQGVDREQVTLFPARLDEYVAEYNPVRAVDAFVDGLDLDGLGFIAAPTGGEVRIGGTRQSRSESLPR